MLVDILQREGVYGTFFCVKDVDDYIVESDGESKLIAGTGEDEKGNKIGKTYEFVIGEAALTKAEKETEPERVFGTSVSLSLASLNGSVGFAPTKISEDTRISVLYKQMQITPPENSNSVWARADYKGYYTKFEITYFVKEGARTNYENDPAPTVYYTENEYKLGAVIGAIPNEKGTYTVFYKISAPNYSDQVVGLYELNIYDYIYAPEVGSLEFTGNSVIGDVYLKLDNKILEYCDIFTLREGDTTPSRLLQFNGGNYDTYANMGQHYVFLKIKDSVSKYIRWDSSIPVDTSHFASGTATSTKNDLKYLIVSFDVVASSGLERVHLSVNEWNYGEFNSKNNAPKWLLDYYTDESRYEFVLTSGENKYYFFNDPAKELGDRKGFAEAPAGTYTLTGYVPDETNPAIRLFEISIEIVISKSTPVLSTVPYVDSWSYGNYTAQSVKPVYSFLYNNAELMEKVTVKYSTESEFASGKYSDSLPLNSEGQLPVGTYYVVLVLEGDANFSKWTYGVRFSVMSKVNFDWVYGEYNSNIISTSQYGSTVTIRFKNKNEIGPDWYRTIESLPDFIQSENELAVGEYLFEVRLNGGALVDSGTFTVSKAVNSWTTIPSIIGWVEGSYSASANSPKAAAAYGSSAISYVITDGDGKEYTLQDAGSLAAGTYSLTVTIEGTDNWDGLSAVVHFNVTAKAASQNPDDNPPDDNNPTVVTEEVSMGLVVALIAAAIVAIALAATGTVLLALHIKKQPKSRKPANKATGRK